MLYALIMGIFSGPKFLKLANHKDMIGCRQSNWGYFDALDGQSTEQLWGQTFQ